MPAPNDLRHFTDVDDLFDNIPNGIILSWVNELWEKKKQMRRQGEQYRVKQQMLAKLAMKHLDPDEVKRVMDAAAEKAER